MFIRPRRWLKNSGTDISWHTYYQFRRIPDPDSFSNDLLKLHTGSVGLAGDVRNVGAGDTEITEFTIGQTVQFGNCVTVTAPVVERANDVHF